MQFVGALNVENADVRVLQQSATNGARSVALQLLARAFSSAQCVDMLRIGVMRDVYVHANMELHH